MSTVITTTCNASYLFTYQFKEFLHYQHDLSTVIKKNLLTATDCGHCFKPMDLKNNKMHLVPVFPELYVHQDSFFYTLPPYLIQFYYFLSLLSIHRVSQLMNLFINRLILSVTNMRDLSTFFCANVVLTGLLRQGKFHKSTINPKPTN